MTAQQLLDKSIAQAGCLLDEATKAKTLEELALANNRAPVIMQVVQAAAQLVRAELEGEVAQFNMEEAKRQALQQKIVSGPMGVPR